MKKKKLLNFFPFLLAGIFLVLGVLTLEDYGVNWDEPVHFMRGQAYLHYFLTGKKDYQGLPKLKIHYPKNDRYQLTDKIDFEDDQQFRRSLYQNDHWNGEWFFENDSPHPPLNDILASLSNYLFYQKLGLLADIEAYHLLEILAGAVLILVVSLLAKEAYGHFAGLVAGLALFLSPLFWAESHFNIKDPVEACFFGLAVYACWRAVKFQSPRWVIGFSIFTGMALAIKFNIVFLALILLPWLAARYFPQKRRQFNLPKKFLFSLCFFPLIVFLIFFLSWPYLWQNPERGIVETIQYYQGIGLHQNFQPANFYFHGFNTYPILAILFTTPLVILFFALVGITASLFLFKKEENKTSFLWFLWLIVPIARVTVPGTTIYGGVRQIMEYIPAMALLAGLGAGQLRGWVANKLDCLFSSTSQESRSLPRHLRGVFGPFSLNTRYYILNTFLLLSFLPLTLKLIQLHPNEGLYFNSLIGGLKGAAERNFPHWGMSLGNEYRQGIEWFNQNAPRGANLTLARGLLSNLPRIWIRPDINFGEAYFSGEERKGEYIMGLTHEGWKGWIPEKAEYLKTLKPVYQLEVEGVSVLSIWEND